jgi:hypothetical protein
VPPLQRESPPERTVPGAIFLSTPADFLIIGVRRCRQVSFEVNQQKAKSPLFCLALLSRLISHIELNIYSLKFFG